MTTDKPGMCASHPHKLCSCCPASPYPPPQGARTTKGTFHRPPEKALTDQEISDPFVIDNTRPVVQTPQSKLANDKRCTVRGTATDQYSTILTMSYSINAGDWVLVYPTDEIFDTQTEPFTFTTPSLPPGENTIVIKVIDAVGNVGCGKVVVSVK